MALYCYGARTSGRSACGETPRRNNLLVSNKPLDNAAARPTASKHDVDVLRVRTKSFSS